MKALLNFLIGKRYFNVMSEKGRKLMSNPKHAKMVVEAIRHLLDNRKQ